VEYKVDLQDVRFILRDQLRLLEWTQTEEWSDYTWDDYDMILTEMERFAREVIHKTSEDADNIGAVLEDGQVRVPKSYHTAAKALTESGWNEIAAETDVGGQGLPETFSVVLYEMFIGASPGFMFIPGLSRAASRLIYRAGTPEMVSTYCQKMNSGQWAGTMCLTEPQAGTAVGDCRSMATRSSDGDHYLIKGQKIFISAGDQDITENIIHLVLARTPGAAPGIRGISLFLVPKMRADGASNDVAVSALEEKMGLHGSPTCGLSFGDNDDCHGWIIGEEGRGIQHMFLMMNEARLAVGIQASGMANWAYQLALAYALERIQGTDIAAMKDANAERVAIIKHPDVRRMLLTMKCYAEGIRSLIYMTSTFSDRHDVTTDEKERTQLRHLIEILTPICKAYGTYRGLEVIDLAMLVHGGYGYIREYKVEGLLRDAKVGPIYEGTNGIQALDLLGRKVGRKGGIMFMTFMQWVNEFIASHKEHEVVGPLIAKLEAAKNTLATVTMALQQKSVTGDVYYPALSASPYLEMFGHVVMARQLIDQAVIAADKSAGASDSDAQFYQGKIKAAEFFTYQILPQVDAIATAIQSDDTSALEIQF
jgi:alkylation response protein AidB-like acyl-CoA dehydrogenase